MSNNRLLEGMVEGQLDKWADKSAGSELPPNHFMVTLENFTKNPEHFHDLRGQWRGRPYRCSARKNADVKRMQLGGTATVLMEHVEVTIEYVEPVAAGGGLIVSPFG